MQQHTTEPVEENPPRTLIRIDGAVGRVEYYFNLFAAISILILMLLAVAQILSRTLFNFPIPGFIDFTEQAMAVFAFLGVAYCQKVGAHIRMGLLVGRLSGRRLWISEFFGVLLIWLVVSLLVAGSWLHFQRAWELGDSTIDIALPVWPSKLIVPVALSLLWIRLILNLYGYARLIAHPGGQPHAVPRNTDTLEKAESEIKSAFGEGSESKGRL